MAKANQKLLEIKYFISRVSNNPDKQKRQTTYIEALEAFGVFPPKRHNNSVAFVAKGSMVIGRKKLADSQFDKEITKKDGYILRKPDNWK